MKRKGGFYHSPWEVAYKYALTQSKATVSEQVSEQYNRKSQGTRIPIIVSVVILEKPRNEMPPG